MYAVMMPTAVMAGFPIAGETGCARTHPSGGDKAFWCVSVGKHLLSFLSNRGIHTDFFSTKRSTTYQKSHHFSDYSPKIWEAKKRVPTRSTKMEEQLAASLAAAAAATWWHVMQLVVTRRRNSVTRLVAATCKERQRHRDKFRRTQLVPMAPSPWNFLSRYAHMATCHSTSQWPSLAQAVRA